VLNGQLRVPRRRIIPRVAVVGLGYWGPNLVRVLSERTDVDVRWICDLEQDRLDAVTYRYPDLKATRDLDDILSDPAIDGVLIATPVATHYELAMRCMAAGKHTFVEKPLAPSSVQAGELIEYAVLHNVVVMCGHTFLYSPPVRAVKRLIEDGELGDIYFVSASRVNLGLHQRDVSVVWDLGPHDFSILLYWLGEPPTSIRATGRASIVPGIADVAFVSMEFGDGPIANVELSWLAPSKLRRTVIVGSKKMVVYEDGSPEPVKIYDRGVEYEDPQTFGEWHLSYRSGDILTPKLASDEPLTVELGAFVQAMRSGQAAAADLQLARDVVRLAEAADDSLSNGGVQIELSEMKLRAA
jgi:predicted dehydrogenase